MKKKQETPLSYLGLRCVVEHMNANQRFFFSTRCQPFKTIHNQLPIHVHHLNLTASKLVIDGFEHSFTTMVRHPDGERALTKEYKKSNKKGGMPEDLEEGMKEEKDIKISEVIEFYYGDEDRDDEPGPVDPRINFVEEVPEAPQNEVVIIERPRVRNEIDPHLQQWYLQRAQEREMLFRHITTVCYHIKFPYSKKVRTFTLPEGIQISDAMRHFLGLLLNFQRETSVDRLEIGMNHGILRIPDGLGPFRIREFQTQHAAKWIIPAITPIVRARKLEKLLIEAYHRQDEIFTSQVLLDCEALFIRIPRSRGTWLRLFRRLPNNYVHVSIKRFPGQELVDLVHNWIEQPRELGTKFAFQCENVKGHLENVLGKTQMVKKVLPGKKSIKFPFCASIKLGALCELNIYGVEARKEFPENCISHWQSQWEMQFWKDSVGFWDGIGHFDPGRLLNFLLFISSSIFYDSKTF